MRETVLRRTLPEGFVGVPKEKKERPAEKPWAKSFEHFITGELV